MLKIYAIAIGVSVFLSSCGTIGKSYNPEKKYSRQELQQDYTLLRDILEKKHPAIYWYTPKDSMDYFFEKGYDNIADSMTELQFGWEVVAPVISKIRCGHTSFSMSKGWNRFVRNKRIPSFPLYLKVWGDTMVVTGNLNRKDSVIKRGMLITSINSLHTDEIVKKVFDHLSLDGYSDNVNYVRLSGNFPYFHRNVFGIYKNYRVGYIDSAGNEKTVLLPMYNPATDTADRKKAVKGEKLSRPEFRKEKGENYRSLVIDTSINMAVMTLNTFSKGGGRHLRTFFRRSFRYINKKDINNMVLDLRSNGGGDIGMHVLLTKYLRNTPFKVADTAYSVARTLAPYSKYIHNGFFNNLGLIFMDRKKADGNYHYRYWEQHVFKPKAHNNYTGKLYVLINGPTFSASTLFCNAVKGQSNVVLVGEEAGGGWHGNNGILIPDIILPATKLRIRLPLYKLVQYNHVPKDGRGVAPDIYIPPTVENVRREIDRKMEFVKGMIRESIVAGYQPIPVKTK